MSFIKYYLSTALLILSAFWYLGVFLQPLSGDLTRLGEFSERDFEYTAKQPQIAIKDTPVETKPTVIVLGDSFSDGNLWQSVIMDKSGFKILTFQWSGLDNPFTCLESWIETVNKTYPTVKYIIVETVERNFLERFVSQQFFSQSMRQIPVNADKHTTAITKDFNIKIDMPDPNYAVRATINSFRKFETTTESGDAFITPLNRNDLFSNRKPNLLIYYKDDDAKKNWTANGIHKAVRNIKHIESLARGKGITFIMVVVPDKLTTYYKYIINPPFHQYPPDVWKELDEQEITQANLRDPMILASSTTQDLYLPNNTHIGTKGYTLMGNIILKRLNEIESSLHK